MKGIEIFGNCRLQRLDSEGFTGTCRIKLLILTLPGDEAVEITYEARELKQFGPTFAHSQM